MKRFYCVECRKVKRVRQWPTRIDEIIFINSSHSKVNNFTKPQDRIGHCNRHNDGKDAR